MCIRFPFFCRFTTKLFLNYLNYLLFLSCVKYLIWLLHDSVERRCSCSRFRNCRYYWTVWCFCRNEGHQFWHSLQRPFSANGCRPIWHFILLWPNKGGYWFRCCKFSGKFLYYLYYNVHWTTMDLCMSTCLNLKLAT